MSKIRMKLTLAFLVLAVVLWQPVNACTAVWLSTVSGNHVHGRTIEWGSFDLKSKLIISPHNQLFTSALPKNKKGVTWFNRYGFVGVSVSEDRFIGEGMNEARLNAGLLYFSGYGSLAPFDPENTENKIADMDLVRWTLGQFKTVEQVKAALAGITLAPIFLDENDQPSPTAHWRVTDASGGSIVIEIMNEGEMAVHENTVGVLTDSPDFP